MTSNNETISRLKSSSGEHLNFFRKVSSFIGYWRSHDIWQWHHFPASLQASNISKSVQSHWLPRGHTKSNIRLSTVYEIKIFKWWVFDSGLSSKRLRNWWSSVWFVKVVHISVTGDTLFEELLVSKPNETKKKKICWIESVPWSWWYVTPLTLACGHFPSQFTPSMPCLCIDLQQRLTVSYT